MRPFHTLLVLLIFASTAGPTVAGEFGDAADGFSAEQGENGWRYRLWNPSGNLHDLVLWDPQNKQWKEGDGAIWADGAHPHSTDWWVVREWTCPKDAKVIMSGSAALFDQADGVSLKILKGYDLGEEIWSADLAANENKDYTATAELKRGEQLIFAIKGKDGIRFDATSWKITIEPAP
jgi:hypothetical protein